MESPFEAEATEVGCSGDIIRAARNGGLLKNHLGRQVSYGGSQHESVVGDGDGPWPMV